MGGDMDRMVRRAERLQKRVEEVRAQLSARVFEGEAEGLVRARVNGKPELVGLAIAPEAIVPVDPGRLEGLVIAAVNMALGASKAVVDREMRRATKGFSIPGL